MDTMFSDFQKNDEFDKDNNTERRRSRSAISPLAAFVMGTIFGVGVFVAAEFATQHEDKSVSLDTAFKSLEQDPRIDDYQGQLNKALYVKIQEQTASYVETK